LKTVAEELGLPLGERTRTYNSRLAQELAKWAESQGKGDEFHDAVFRAYFVDGRNIAEIDVLADLAHEAGLSEDEARIVVRERSFREAVDADWMSSHQMGITAVPTFVMGREAVVGAQPYGVLEHFLVQNKGKRRRGVGP